VVEGNRIAELKDVFQPVRDAGAKKVRFNIETKVEDGRSGVEGMAALTQAMSRRSTPPAWRSAPPSSRSTGHR
jgi:hypothetical protein